MKTLYMMIHGRSSDRRLRAEDKRAVAEAAGALNTELDGVEEVVVYHGPRVKARNTARALERELSAAVMFEQRPELDPYEFKVSTVVYDAPDNSIIIGHADDLERLTGESLLEGEYLKMTIGDGYGADEETEKGG